MFGKKWFVPAAAVLLVVFTAVMLIFLYPRDSMPSSYTDAKKGVVFIAADFNKQVYPKKFGSGFAIGKRGKKVLYIVTNYHVVFDKESGDKADSVVVYFSAAANRYMTAQIYRYDAARDVAILRLPEPTQEVVPLKICKYNQVDTSGMFYALGYPARATAGTDYERYDKSDIVTTSGMIARRTMMDERDVYMLDLEISQGNSGGPLVNSKGEVVGINTFSIINTSLEQANYAVCIDELTRIIDADEVPYTLTTDANIGAILVLAATVAVDLVLLLLIVFSLVSPKKATAGYGGGRQKAGAAADRRADVEENWQSRNIHRNVTMSWQDSDVGLGDISSTIAVSDITVVITGINGARLGESFVVLEKLTFGRDPNRCDVVMPVDAEGVSGYHCQVRLCNAQLMLMDVGSSYGTYVNGGIKVAKDTEVELKDGDIFYLGSRNTMFQVHFG